VTHTLMSDTHLLAPARLAKKKAFLSLGLKTRLGHLLRPTRLSRTLAHLFEQVGTGPAQSLGS